MVLQQGGSREQRDVLYLYRFYDPSSQRWINRDPAAERSGANLYRFAGNDPVDYCDPWGFAYGNPVSGFSGPVGPSDPYSPGGYLFLPAPDPVGDCISRCLNASGYGWAIGALGLSSGTVGSIPKAAVGLRTAGGSPYTTGFSIIQHIGGPALRNLGRQLNPYGRAVQCAAAGYLAGLIPTCSVLCNNNPNTF